MTIHLLHGIHTAENGGNISKLLPALEKTLEEDVVYHQYGYALALTTRFQNPRRAEKIARKVNPGDVCIGHSNGCAIIWLMANNLNVHMRGAVLINAALDRDAQFPEFVEFIHVYYNKGDGAVPLAKLLWAHPWGDMGQVGYINGADSRVKNIDCQTNVPEEFVVDGHSDIFSPEKLGFWSLVIAGNIKREG